MSVHPRTMFSSHASLTRVFGSGLLRVCCVPSEAPHEACELARCLPFLALYKTLIANKWCSIDAHKRTESTRDFKFH